MNSKETPVSFFFLDFLVFRCKRLNKLGLHPFVLSKSCSRALAVRAKNWCEEAHKILKLCVNAGNIEANYILGMIWLAVFSDPDQPINRGLGWSISGYRTSWMRTGRSCPVRPEKREIGPRFQGVKLEFD
ncbi:hypothetical protein HanIR_Chr09g0444041 [Helianthus annuus]|nr:hypothetical protein HanIR_Chr09g0444041 [Helianthus annuus]